MKTITAFLITILFAFAIGCGDNPVNSTNNQIGDSLMYSIGEISYIQNFNFVLDSLHLNKVRIKFEVTDSTGQQFQIDVYDNFWNSYYYGTPIGHTIVDKTISAENIGINNHIQEINVHIFASYQYPVRLKYCEIYKVY